ncbi:MAG: helix-turn-helix transcriptional regulator [Actinomycetota bacterium]
MPTDPRDALGGYIREQRRQAEMSLRKLADLAGVSNPYLSQIERGLKRPSAEILQQIARALEVSAESLYVRAGILDEEPESDLIAAIRAQDDLTVDQKQVLIQVYESFLVQNQA